MKKNILNLVACLLLQLVGTQLCAQKYADIYDAMPNMTLDQQYSALMAFQKANPYFANTYIQLGAICEKKMILFDPLRDNESVRFWAQNAQLFYGNLKVFYKNNDVRSQSEFYENLRIPFSGKRLEDADMWAYVERHKDLCKNHADTTTLIYNAIERSKYHYDMCIVGFKELCNMYIDINDMLLQDSPETEKRLNALSNHIDECIKEFKEYKRLSDLYPVMNYKQFYEMKPIETFRLDGLTNSDFYNNRFTMWDYRKWIDEYHTTMKDHIAPLSQDIDKIYARYMDARKEYDAARQQTEIETRPAYDDTFLFRLKHWDNQSLIVDLFAYLESTRKMIALAGDSIGRNIPYSEALTIRKVRNLYNMTLIDREVRAMREKLIAQTSEKKLLHFADFWKSKFNNADGVKRFALTDTTYCQNVLDHTADELAAYIEQNDERFRSQSNVYSTAAGAGKPALPLWVTTDPKSVGSTHISTHVARNMRTAKATYVAGYLKANNRQWFVAGIANDNKTAWLNNLKGVNSVSNVEYADGTCIVSCIKDLKPHIIVFDEAGKQVYDIVIGNELSIGMNYEQISGRTLWAYTDEAKAQHICGTDSLGKQIFDVKMADFKQVAQIFPSTSGALVVGTTSDNAVCISTLDIAGKETGIRQKAHIEANHIILSRHISATEVVVLAQLNNGKHKFLNIRLKE